MWHWLSRFSQPSEAAEEPVSEQGLAPSREEIRSLNAFYYDVASTRLNSQFTYLRQIDSKSTSFFTIGSTVLPIVAGFIASDNSALFDCVFAIYALFAGFIAYLALAIFYVLSFVEGKWRQIPDMEQFREISTQFAVEDLQRALADACVDAYGVNEPAIDRKAKKSAKAMWCLFFEVIFLSFAVLIPLWPFSVP